MCDLPREKLVNKGLLIVKNHRKAVLTTVFGVIGTPSRSPVLTGKHIDERGCCTLVILPVLCDIVIFYNFRFSCSFV